MSLKIIALVIIAGISIPIPSNADSIPKKNILAHYMPWYATKAFSGYWGWHWTMNHFNPDELDANGRYKIASHYCPLIGPYDSNDPDAIECHVLLMKLAGIDGIIIDWYGIDDLFDYAFINKNTQQIIRYAEKAGLIYAICYEDQSIKKMIEQGLITENEAVERGQATMRWLQENCFSHSAYLKADNRPVLLVFGPQYFKEDQWSQLFSVLPQRPILYVLPYFLSGSEGVFGWIPVNGGTTTPEQWREYLRNLYADNKKSCIGVEFPQFHDIYEEAKVHKSYGYLDANGSKTLEETLDMTLNSNCESIQLVTFNDYGEGTMIEPTTEFGYRYLEIIQQRLNQGHNRAYSAENLRLPVELYKLKKKYRHNQPAMENLSRCSALLFSGDLVDAEKLLERYQED